MKKILMALFLMAGFTMGAAARDEYVHDGSILPETAKVVLSKNFKSANVSVVKLERTLGRISEYDVMLSDGTEVSFDRHGDWETVETNNSKAVPSSIVPKPISDFVAKSHPNTRIVGIERDQSGFDIDLSNGVDIRFNRLGSFVRYED